MTDPYEIVGAKIADGEPVQMGDGTWWLYDREERDWCRIVDPRENPAVAATRPEVIEDGGDPGYCEVCGRCFGCGEYVA